MLVSDFNYDLPEERIAKFPPKERGASRLLVLNRKTGELQDSRYRALDQFLHAGDVLILNDTRVMQSRLFCELPDGRKRELVVLEKHGDEPQRVMYRGKLHDGDILTIADTKIKIMKVLEGGIAEVESAVELSELAEKYGTVPLPPYLHRDATDDDKKRYQTVWAKNMGSAAAPTASLNMTDDLLQRLREKGVQICYLTLHVGLGTFLPIRTEEVEGHKMHSEWFSIPAETLDAIKKVREARKAVGEGLPEGMDAEEKSMEPPRVVALGTTVARTLEHYARTGKTEGEDDIFIYPGFEFKIVDALITNYHAPKSTVLMLASAFAGWENLKHAYEHAVAEKYNFLSYGDSMLIC
jgi:S-adenosylmethionine:tRNA ribosyltransferase-isomerase